MHKSNTFLWTIKKTLGIINGSKLLESSEDDNFCFQFEKDITFRQLYDVLKRHKECIFTAWKVSKYGVFLVRIFLYSVRIQENTDQKKLSFGHFSRNVLIKRSSVDLLERDLQECSFCGQWILCPESRLPATINELGVRFTCEDIENACSGNTNSALLKPCLMKILILIWLLIQILKTQIQATVTAMITIKLLLSIFFEWAREGNKLKKIRFKENIDSAIRKFTSTITTLKHHLYVKRVQYDKQLG